MHPGHLAVVLHMDQTVISIGTTLCESGSKTRNALWNRLGRAFLADDWTTNLVQQQTPTNPHLLQKRRSRDETRRYARTQNGVLSLGLLRTDPGCWQRARAIVLYSVA